MNFIKDIIDYITKLFTWWTVIMPWQQGIRVSFGKKMELLGNGIFLKLPLIHSVYVQERRLRVINLPIQTISSCDGHPLTVSCSVGYSIKDIVKLYNSLYQPDLTVSNIVASKIAEQVFSLPIANCEPTVIESNISDALAQLDYGLHFEYVRIINFASVKTFRLIQDQSYMYEGLDLLSKK